MPNLSIPEITKDGKEYRSVLLVEKTFEKNGKTNVFKTDGGLFHAKYILIGTIKITKSPDVDKTAGEILSLRLKKGLDRILKIGGTYAGSKSNVEIPITQLEKSEEFGGMPAGGTRVNKGLLFETDLAKRLDEYVEGTFFIELVDLNEMILSTNHNNVKFFGIGDVKAVVRCSKGEATSQASTTP